MATVQRHSDTEEISIIEWTDADAERIGS